MKHKHHIIPRHMGGSDDPSNLIELSIPEHAEAHRLLFEQHGRWEDELAWKGLSGQIGKEEIIRTALSMATKGKKKSKEFCDNLSAFRKTFRYSDESKLKMSLAKKGKKQKPEVVEARRLRQIGTHQPESQKIKLAKKLSKRWWVTDPTGKSFEVINLRKFTREKGLDQGNLSRGSHRGWKAYILT